MTPTPDDWNETQLALVRLTAGASVPYCSLELRSFHPEGDENDASVLRRTFGLRALMISEDAFPYDGSPMTTAHMPVLLRLGVRARKHRDGNRLLLHVPGKKTSAAVQILESDSAQDLLAIPERLPESRVLNAIDMPPLRLVEGIVKAKLIIPDSGDFNKLLSLDRKGKQAFGGVQLKNFDPYPSSNSTRSHWEVYVTPQGFEFDATLPDPTEAFLPTGPPQPHLTARLRLERDPAGDYRLRLIGGENLEAPHDRLAKAFAGILLEDGCPLKYRFDAALAVPPLIWPLDFERGGLKLRTGTVEIDTPALDLRIVTRSEIEGARDGLAKAELTRVELITDANGVSLVAAAGKQVKGKAPSYWLKFEPTEDSAPWKRSLDGALEKLPVTLPADALRERLTALYQTAGVLKPSSPDAPYAFFALRDGWLQYPLPPRKTDDDNPGATTMQTAPETRAIIGRIVFDQAENHQESVRRGLVIESAESLIATVRWSRNSTEVKLEAARLGPGQEEGRLHGFLFAADISPTAAEAVPDLSRGSAALREVVLDFSRFMEGRGDATFAWKQDAGTLQTWSLAWQLGLAAADGPPVLAWTPLGPYPLATNYAMTRTGVPRPDPSRTRGYFPRQLEGGIRMVFTRAKEGEITENELPELLGKTDDDRAIGKPFPQPGLPSSGRPIRTALLPTLHGVEFTPLLPDSSWRYTATLRYDLPLLDELFANTELPPPEPANRQPALAADPAPVSAGTEITALYPDDLAQEWRKTESRMRLTWTQDVEITKGHPVVAALTTTGDVDFKNLAAPLVYKASVAVALSPTLPLGRLRIGDPNGDHSLAAAAIGLSGHFKIADNGQDLEPTDESGAVHVTGYGVDQYQHPERDGTYLFDNRGTAFAAEAQAGGTQRRVRRMASAGPAADREFTLLTMPTVLEVKIPGLHLGFHVRDLPVVAVGGVLRFTGIADTTNRSENPIEGRWGQDGQSFSNSDLAQSLHEWRAFPLLDDTTPGVLGEYDIPVGDYFRFRPLRLVNAEFDPDGAVLKVMILGGLSPRSPHATGAHENRDFAFGVDRVYDRDSLFTLTLTPIAGTAGDPDGDAWKASFNSQVLTGRLLPVIQMGRPLPDSGIRFQRLLEPHGPAGLEANYYFRSKEPVAAVFIMRFAPGAGSALKPEEVIMSARLFGSYRDFTATDSGIEETAEGLKLTFTVDSEPGSTAQGRLTGCKIEVWLSSKREDRFAVSGTLQLGRIRPFLRLGQLEKPEPELSTILSISPDEVQWLDLKMSFRVLDGKLDLSINHDSGAILATIDNFITTADMAPIFGLPFAVGSRLNLTFTGIFAEVLTLATAHLHVDFREGAGSLGTLGQDWLLGGPPPADPVDCKHPAAGEGALRLTWSSGLRQSPIRWPLADGIGLDGALDLKAISEGALDPPPFGNSGAPARLLTLKNGTALAQLTHKSELHLRNHQISLQDLAWVKGEDTKPQLVPLRALHTVALVAHALGDGTTEATWTSCDHITFATPDALKTEAAALSLVPRHSHRRRGNPDSPSLEFRDADVHNHQAHAHLPEGVAALGDANLSGWHDPALLEYLTKDLKIPAGLPLIFGTAALCIPKVVKDDEPPSRAHLAMLPWAIGLGEQALFQLGKAETTWRIATADSWAAHAIHLQAQGRIVALSPDATEGQLLSALRQTCGAPDPARLIPVAAGLAEPWEAGKPKKINKLEQRADAPFFLHCLLALAACWQTRGEIKIVSTLAADLDWQAAADGKCDTGPRLIRLRVAERPAARLQPEDGRVSADLIVLSRERALRLPAYRMIREAVAGLQDEGDRAEMKDFAQRSLRAPLYAIRIVPATRQVVRHQVADPLDPLESPAALLTDAAHDIVASSALGWPYATGLGNPDALPLMAARIQPQMALQSHAAGFAARGQRVFFPAVAPSPCPPESIRDTQARGLTRSIYVSFGEHVIFDRGKKPFHYDGPAARHMAPVMPRRRAPLEPDLQTSHLSTPLSAPVIDRLVIGRRPGVLEVSTVSATIVAHPGDKRAALDIGWPGMGRPADIGPVVAAQMRNPRSPLLPADPRLPDLPLRRRTYLSRADQVPDPVGEDPSRTKLALFRDWPGIHDVIRLTDPSPAASAPAPWHWRIRATLSFDPALELAPISPTWSGEVKITLDSLVCDAKGNLQAAADPAGLLGLEKDNSVVATLVVGDRSWVSEPFAAAGDLILGFKLLTDLREAIAAATADTPLFLTLRFPLAKPTGDAAPAAAELDIAGVPEFTLPVMLAPGRQRTVHTEQTTVAFGDPSYDRSLASQTSRNEQIFQATNKAANYRLAADRLEYNASGLVHITIAPVYDESGGFISRKKVADGVTAGELLESFSIDFQRAIPNAKPQDPQSEALQLGSAAGKMVLKTGQTYVFRIEDLMRMGDPVHKSVLRGGDILVIEVSVDGGNDKSVSLLLPIVTKPVIAPPPSVFSVIERLNGVEGKPVRLRLHAPAALPTRIEFEDLYRDLGLGHVRRRGLYVWHYGNAGLVGKAAQDARRKSTLDLLKLDRSGGAQLPEE